MRESGYTNTDGSPTVFTEPTVADSYQDDGRISVWVHEVGTYPFRWGVAEDLLPGSSGPIVLGTDGVAAVTVQPTGSAVCSASGTSAVFTRRGSAVGPSPGAPIGSALRVAGVEVADSLETETWCDQPDTFMTITLRRRPVPDPSPLIDWTPRVPDVYAFQAVVTTSGGPRLQWTAADPGQADALTGLVTWRDAGGAVRRWEFRARPPAAGTHGIGPPRLPADVSAFFAGTFRGAILHYVDADFADGYEDAWQLHVRPYPPVADVQFSAGQAGLQPPLPF